MILLILIWSSTTIAGETNSNCTEFTDNDAKLIYATEGKLCEIKAMLVAECNDTTRFKGPVINPISISCDLKPEDMPMVQTNSRHIATSIGLGAVVGLLIVLLLIITIGWMWTCWTKKRQGRITTNSRDIRKCATSDSNFDLSSNPSYGGNQQTIQNHPLPTPTPTYETIPPLSNLMDGIKLDLVETKEERSEASNNREEAYHKLNRAQTNDKNRESKDQTHRSGQTQGYQGKERVPDSGSGTSSQEIQHSHANTSTERLFNSPVPGEEEQSASIGKRSQEKETENSSVKKNDKELDGTTLEHNHNQTENGENEQDLPKKRAIPRDYEQAVPSK